MNEAERGLLPAEATVVVGQPLTMDPSRAPEGKGLLWIQLQELPWHIRATPPASSTSATARGRRRCASATPTGSRHGSRATSRTSSRRSSTASCSRPHDLEAANVNLVHGDPYGGSLALDQNFLWRPFGTAPGPSHASVEGVWHVGASTHPGPGLGAGSGTLVADAILEPAVSKRLATKLATLARRS